jgi:hypothetical protein
MSAANKPDRLPAETNSTKNGLTNLSGKAVLLGDWDPTHFELSCCPVMNDLHGLPHNYLTADIRYR